MNGHSQEPPRYGPGRRDHGGRCWYRSLKPLEGKDMNGKPEAHLLVVDDEPNIVELLSATLRYEGFEVSVAMTGNEASHNFLRGGKVVTLSPTEFKLLRYLMVNAGRVQSNGQILDHVGIYDFD